MDKARLAGSDMNFLTGREDMFAPVLTVGARGCMTGCSGIIPEIMVGIWDAYHAGDYGKANRLQFSILAFIRAMFAAPFPHGFKAALETRGFEMGPPKQPLSAAEEFNLSGIKARIKNLLKGLLDVIEKEELDKEKAVNN
jgi:dihydrodipicolinate synthase/N-acetylneuraminate lyase